MKKIDEVDPSPRVLALVENIDKNWTYVRGEGLDTYVQSITLTNVKRNLPAGLSIPTLQLALSYVEEIKAAVEIMSSEHIFSEVVRNKTSNEVQVITSVDLGTDYGLRGSVSYQPPSLDCPGNSKRWIYQPYEVIHQKIPSFMNPSSYLVARYYNERKLEEALKQVCGS